MRPEGFTTIGFVVLVAGFVLVTAGAGLLAEQILCSSSFNSCTTSSVESAIRTATSLLLLTFGIPLIIVGAIFTAVGHMTQHLRPQEPTQGSTIVSPLRVCIKCGREVESSASFCPSCGNQLPK